MSFDTETVRSRAIKLGLISGEPPEWMTDPLRVGNVPLSAAALQLRGFNEAADLKRRCPNPWMRNGWPALQRTVIVPIDERG